MAQPPPNRDPFNDPLLQHPHQPAQKYQFGPEELKVLRECNKEAFYQRCLPLGATFGLTAYYAVKSGFLRPSPRWGATLKTIGGVFFGYIVGKLSYQSQCMEKMMKLDTPLAAQLRKQRGRTGLGERLHDMMDPAFHSVGLGEDTSTLLGTTAAPRDSNQSSDIMDIRPISNFDTEHSIYSADDLNRPVDAEMLNDENLPPPAPKNSATYDDLRRRNRIEYEMQRYPPQQQQQPPQPAPPAYQQDYRQSQPRDPMGQRKQKNEYGDVWEDVPSK